MEIYCSSIDETKCHDYMTSNVYIEVKYILLILHIGRGCGKKNPFNPIALSIFKNIMGLFSPKGFSQLIFNQIILTSDMA